jgi:hypothetical protein
MENEHQSDRALRIGRLAFKRAVAVSEPFKINQQPQHPSRERALHHIKVGGSTG